MDYKRYMDKRPKDELIKKDDATEGGENDIANDNTWGTDQRERGYYYDDAHGYQKYIPEEDVSEIDAEE